MNTYIHLFSLDGRKVGTYRLGTLDSTIKTAECEFCPCVLPGEVAAWFQTFGAKLSHWKRPAGIYSRFIAGTFSLGPLPGVFAVHTQKSWNPSAEPQAMYQQIQREGHPWHPEPIFTGDGDKHHG